MNNFYVLVPLVAIWNAQFWCSFVSWEQQLFALCKTWNMVRNGGPPDIAPLGHPQNKHQGGSLQRNPKDIFNCSSVPLKHPESLLKVGRIRACDASIANVNPVVYEILNHPTSAQKNLRPTDSASSDMLRDFRSYSSSSIHLTQNFGSSNNHHILSLSPPWSWPQT